MQRYRRLVKIFFLMSLLGLVICTYYYLRDQIPDQILVEEGKDLPVLFRSSYGLMIEEDAIEAATRGSSDIPRDNLHMSDRIQCSLFGVIPLKTVDVERTKREKITAGGMPVGIYLHTDGILVIGTGTVQGEDGKEYEPAQQIVKTGDYIMKANGNDLDSKEELVECIHASRGQEVKLEVVRGEETLTLSVTPVQTADQEYKAGIWVRNDAQGIGTLTYVDENSRFGALGHGISDVDTSTLLSMREGKVYQADVLSVKKGQRGEPGELVGVIHYSGSAQVGTITDNSGTGIYGMIDRDGWIEEVGTYEIAYKQEIEKGPASILCSVDGETKEYRIEIESIELNKKEVNKGMVIRVTDPRLLEKTGGIVQGM